MKMLKTIKLFYILYSVYTVLVMLVSDYNFFDAILGVLAIWLVYIAFYAGFQNTVFSNKNSAQKDLAPRKTVEFFFSRIAEWKAITYLLNLAICVTCSVLAARFYTGKGITQVISGIMNSSSNYNEYQRYFSQSNLAAFSLTKIPYILMLTFLTAMLFWGIIGIALSGKKIRLIQWFYLFGICASFMYFGIARGTNFEMYIIFVLVVFCLLNRSSSDQKDESSDTINKKAIATVIVLGIIFVFAFRIVVQARGVTYKNDICTEISYDPEKLFSRMFPALTNIILSVFSYLGFGIFTIGRTAMDTFNYGSEILSSLLPSGFRLLSGTSLSDLVYERIDVGVRWVPDYIRFIDMFGLPLLLVIVFALGKYMAKKCYNKKNDLLANLIGFVIFMEMLSIPVGNFIMNSTPNELVIIAILMWAAKAALFRGKKQ